MSMPKFPEISSDITPELAVCMILVSIAMEELALSHIINAEGEKLQYVLGTLEANCGVKPTVDEVLAVNHSIACVLDSVLQNQMLLKNKMEKALNVLPRHPYPPHPPCPPPCPPHPPYPPCPPGPKGEQGEQGERGPAGPSGKCKCECKCECKCSAVFKASEQCCLWHSDSALHWNTVSLFGESINIDPCDKTKVNLCPDRRYMVSFAVNARAASDCGGAAAVSLQMISNHKRATVHTFHTCAQADGTFTLSMGGIIVETFGCHSLSSLMLKLELPNSLTLEDSMLNIMEI